MKYLDSIFPDILKLSKKDSDISTKRYGDLRLLNHVIIQSWLILIVLMYFKRWDEINIHFIFLALLCFARGALAVNLTKILNKNEDGRRGNSGND